MGVGDAVPLPLGPATSPWKHLGQFQGPPPSQHIPEARWGQSPNIFYSQKHTHTPVRKQELWNTLVDFLLTDSDKEG